MISKELTAPGGPRRQGVGMKIRLSRTSVLNLKHTGKKRQLDIVRIKQMAVRMKP